MNTNELRKGNFVMDEVSGEWMSMTDITEDLVATVIDRSKFPLKDGWKMAPIPVTPDALKRIGAVAKNANSNFWYIGKFIFALTATGLYLMDQNQNLVPGAVGLKHIHMVQNLVFFLTGREMQLVK